MRRVLAGLALAVASVAAQAALVQITPSASVVNVGDEVIVTIIGSDFSDLLGGGVDVTYGLSLTLDDADVTLLAPPWDPTFPRTEQIDAAIGEMRDFSFNQFAGVSGSFNIGRLTFKAVAPGTIDLLVDTSANFPFADMGGEVFPEYESATVVVVPEPATWGLLGAGLGLMILVGRGRRRLKA